MTNNLIKVPLSNIDLNNLLKDINQELSEKDLAKILGISNN